ncbi:MAG: histidinol-phosphate transaminase [Chloroflexota bacterium]
MSEQHDIRALVRPHLMQMPGYEPVEPIDVMAARLGLRPDQIAKLDGNENPYGPSPRVAERLAAYRTYHIYPDPNQRAVREAIGAYINVSPDQVILGNGSDEMLAFVAQLFVSPGDVIVNCPPTFGVYDFLAEVFDARTITIPRNEDFSLDLPALEQALSSGAKLLYLASPNNPTGNVLPREQLLRILEYPVAVLIDEAYAEFAGESAIDLINEQGNLIVARTFSKWAGLAGLRAGYAVIPPQLVDTAWKVKVPYNLSVAAEQAVLASLDDKDELMANVRVILEERGRMFAELQKVSFLRPYPSAGNYILCEISGILARDVRDQFRTRGILIRYFDSPGLRNCVRISVGTARDTDRVLEALQEIGASVGK